MPQTYDYLIAPKASFDATADAIRAVNGTNSAITWGQDGFASAIGSSRKWSTDGIVNKTEPSGSISTSATSIGSYVFYGNKALTSITAENCTTVGDSSFYGCTGLEFIELKNATITVGTHSFYGCNSLDGCDFTKISDINTSCFRNASVKNCLFNPSSVADSGFRDAKYMSISYFPNLTTITGQYVFAGAYSPTNNAIATKVVCPSLTSIQTQDAFSYNNNLTAVDLGAVASLPTNTLRENANMNVVILRGSSVTTLANINAFANTPFASGKSGGTLYVPNSLKSQYQSATNWVTILGYTNNSIQSIEGSQYENYYADGTPIPTT